MALIKVQNLSKVFKEGDMLPVTALDDVSLDFEEGAFAALAGPSGSGKTTLLNLIGCLDKPSTGKIIFDGEEVSAMSQGQLAGVRLRKIGFIFQDYNLIPILSATENIEYVLWLQGVSPAERRKRSTEICKRFGIEHLMHRRPSKLSRGQQQRVAVARALAHRPRIVLGDELTANLDHKTGAELMDFLKELNQKEGITFLYATHDPVMMKRAGRVVLMQDGRLLRQEENVAK